MKIEKILSQSRRDFTAIMKCEFCNKEEKDNSGYDDDYYHTNVIPNKKCKTCGKSTLSEKGTIEPYITKYPPNFII